MAEGERAFAESKGPRTVVALRISSEANIAARLAAAQLGMSKTAFLTFLVEGSMREWLDAKAPEGDELTKTGEPT